MGHASYKSPRQSAFSHYLRTGQRLPDESFAEEQNVELKFNPYHDPRNGQFTFAPGGPRSSGEVIISDRRKVQANNNVVASNGRRRAATVPARPYLSARHNEILNNAARYPAERGTVERWSGSGDKERFKAQWVHGHRTAIKAAARDKDIPPALLASIAYREAGGDGISDDIAHALRSESGRNLPVTGKLEKLLNRPADHTSFGPLNIQERRAAQILGYGNIGTMSETARRTLASTTKDPTAALFMAAQHLSDLRDMEFRGVPAKDLTRDQMLIIATRYNRGPDLSYAEIQQNTKSGQTYLQKWTHVSQLIR